MVLVPFQVEPGQYSVFVILQDDNLERIKTYDPAEITLNKMPDPWISMKLKDILIGYAVGMLPWYLVAVVWRRRLQVRFHWPAVLRRYVVAGAGCDLTYLVTVWVGMDPMTGMLITYGLGAVALWLFRRGNWPLAATGVLQFPVVWFCVVAFTFWLFPEFIFKFNLAGNWGRPVFGVPVGEIACAFTFGVFWPLFTAVIFNVEIERQPVAGQA